MKFDIDAFSSSNVERCESPLGFNHGIGKWTPNDWYTAMSGEAGELANVLKKLRRLETGATHRTQESDAKVLRAKAREEIADVFIYLDLLAARLDIDLPLAVIEKWNATSSEIGYPFFMMNDGSVRSDSA